MKFRFRLEKILHLTRVKELSKRSEVGAAIRHIQGLQAKRETLMENIRLIFRSSHQMINLHWAPYQAAKIPVDVEELKIVGESIERENVKLSEKREELNRIIMRRKGLESMRNGRLSEYRVTEQRLAQKSLDETHQLLRVERG